MANLETVSLVASEQLTYQCLLPDKSYPNQSLVYVSDSAVSPSTDVERVSVEWAFDVPMGERVEIERFRDLVDRWSAETYHISSLSDIEEHEALQEIIGMGQLVIPLILYELSEKPSWLLLALDAIVDDPPDLREGSQGGLLDSTSVWIEWGEKNGHLPATTKYGNVAFTLAA